MSKHNDMIADIRNVAGVQGGITLSEWEEELVESIEDRLGEEKSLTPKQAEALERIWDRI